MFLNEAFLSAFMSIYDSAPNSNHNIVRVLFFKMSLIRSSSVYIGLNRFCWLTYCFCVARRSASSFEGINWFFFKYKYQTYLL